MRRMVRKVIEGLLIALFCATVTTALACGAEPAPPSPTVTTTNAAASLLVIQDYKSELEDWATTFLQDADVDAFVGLQHPLRPTAEELKRARDFTAYTRRMLSALREITLRLRWRRRTTNTLIASLLKSAPWTDCSWA